PCSCLHPQLFTESPSLVGQPAPLRIPHAVGIPQGSRAVSPSDTTLWSSVATTTSAPTGQVRGCLALAPLSRPQPHYGAVSSIEQRLTAPPPKAATPLEYAEGRRIGIGAPECPC